jgi:hypothetical protein
MNPNILGLPEWRAWVQNIRFEQVRAYLGRGRPYQDVSTPDLKAWWVRTIQDWASNVQSEPPERLDIEAELILRSEQPPVGAVLRQWETIRKAAADALKGLAKNPTERSELLREMKHAWEELRGTDRNGN